MVTLDISEVLPAFPDFRVAFVVCRRLVVPPRRAPALEAAIAEVEAEAATRLADTLLAEVPEVRAWRAAYKAFGVRKTSYRSSVERLLKAVQQGRGLPRVSGLVDAYNAVSVRHRMPVGADDLGVLEGALAFRRARDGDDFIALGDADLRPDPPKPDEVVYADGSRVLCRRWNWYQDARSAIGPRTRRAVLTVQALGADAPVEAAAEELGQWLLRHCAAQCAWAVADAGTPRVEVPLR